MSQARITALGALDEAIEIVRGEALTKLLLSATPALAMTWLALFLFYMERVEGIRSLRGPFALGFACLWYWRALTLGAFAGRAVELLLSSYEEPARHGPRACLLSTATVFGVALWPWLWLLVAAVHVDPWLTLAVLPALSLHGALSASWLASGDALTRRGLVPALMHALRIGEGQRIVGVACELFMLFGAVALFFNLGALLAVVISLSQDLLGLELSFVRAFISPRNHFALIAVAGCALAAFEPLRAALAAVLLVDARLCREALAARALVRRCIAEGSSKVLMLLVLVVPVGSASAESADNVEDTGFPAAAQVLPECDAPCEEARARDDALLVELVSLLDGEDFREFPDDTWEVERAGKETLGGWLKAFLRWLYGEEQTSVRPTAAQKLALPSARSSLIAVLTVFLVSLFAFGARRIMTRRPTAKSVFDSTVDSSMPSSESYLAQANELAEHDPKRALRALYLATLSGLARRGVLSLSPERTNGQYLRLVALRAERTTLSELTQQFERSQYGTIGPTREELSRARALVERLLERGAIA